MEGQGCEEEEKALVSAVSEQELELSRSAKEAFDGRRYEGCLSALNRLVELRRDDWRVAHNRAVAQYLLSNLTKTDEFRRNLITIEQQFERDAECSGVVVSVVEKSVLLFNLALIHQRLHQSTRARDILEMLHCVNMSLAEPLATQVCLLLIEVYMSTYQLDKAGAHLQMLEQRLYGTNNSGASNRGDKDGSDSTSSSANFDCYKPQFHQFKARLHLLHKNIKQCKKEVKLLTSLTGATASAQFRKANVEFLRGNFRKALKVLSSAPKTPHVTDAGECLSAYLFNAIGCIHFEMGRYNLAAHYIRRAVDENDAALNGFPPLDRATLLSGRPLSMLGMNCRHILLYNLGLQQLYGGQPLAAFDSFLVPVQVYHANPCLWLRLAEACIASHAQLQAEQVTQMRNKSSTVQVVVGNAVHQKLIVTPVQWSVKRGGDTQSAMPAPTLEFAAICLRNALFLLPSPSAIAAAQSLSPIESDEGTGDGINHLSVRSLPGPPIQGDSILVLRCSVLACQSYVALGLGDPVLALSAAQQLLDMPTLPGGLKFVGQLYAAEALVLLDRIPEALHYLSPDIVTNISATLTPRGAGDGDASNNDSPPVTHPTGSESSNFPTTLTGARAIMLLNLCSVYCMRKEYDTAHKALQQGIALIGEHDLELSRTAVLLSAYLELMTGNTSQALHTIKKHQWVTSTGRPAPNNTSRKTGLMM